MTKSMTKLKTFYSEDDLVMLSALQHFLYCPRQCALIHIEQLWSENRLTAEGRILHKRVHAAASESRRKIKIEYDMPIRSLALGLSGRADVIEFHRQKDNAWQPFPVEYKRGRPKKHDADRVQLCAQALCLEEMLNTAVPAGALFYGKKRRRLEVEFDVTLRQITKQAAEDLHRLLDHGQTPPPRYSKGCERCSFLEQCLPKIVGKQGQVGRYLDRMVADP